MPSWEDKSRAIERLEAKITELERKLEQEEKHTNNYIRALHSCAARPWVEGEPEKTDRPTIWLVKGEYGTVGVVYWSGIDKAWIFFGTARTFFTERILRHAQINTKEDLEEKVIEMGLCEVDSVYLRPNQLYRFVVIDGCKKCAELASMYVSINTKEQEMKR